jgi:hypothetical protein
MSWHICTSDSYHFEGDGRSSGSAGKLTELPSERLSTAPSLESLLGRWYTDNANVCKGTVGNTEGLLTFSGKRFTGYENECLINKARVEGQTLKIQMTCSGEGEESQETEWFEFVNEKQAKRSVVDGKRRQIALGMFTGLRKGDVLTLTKAAIRDGKIWRRTNKTGQEVSIPVHPDLAHLLATAPRHDAITIAATTRGTPWTESGFNSSFIKAMAKLKRGGKVGDGLTFHGLRRTVGTLLIEAGYDLDTVRRWLGQKTLAMAIHYSETADTSDRMSQVIKKFDPLGSKSRT